ncbi:MAG TPA: DUF697 domain-containing protein [Thermodesulfovibrionia bacterium]|nr:DUF697 domain-containing protein [Thermodesulfovibrionia bacterium]
MEKTEMEKAYFEQESDDIINRYVLASLGAGLVPVPLVDLVALTGLQLKMVHSLAKHYEVEFSNNIGKSVIGSLAGGVLPVAFSPFLGSLLKAIPIIGQTTSAVTMSIVGGASTYALGKVFKKHFGSGGTMEDFEPEKAKGYFAKKYEEGKEIVTKHFKKDKNNKAKDTKDEPKEIKLDKEAPKETKEIKETPKVSKEASKDSKV